jgi:photoactive yellow protein
MLDDLDDGALDALPFGVVALDPRMTVVRMNRTESEASGIQRWRALGRDFFHDVAPGATNRALAQQIRAFAAGARASAITHTFPRRAGADATTIELQRGRKRDVVYLCIRRDAR